MKTHFEEEFNFFRLCYEPAHHHGLSCSEVWQQHVFLHDVAGHLPECPQVPGFPIYQDLTLHPCFPGKEEGHTNKHWTVQWARQTVVEVID